MFWNGMKPLSLETHSLYRNKGQPSSCTDRCKSCKFWFYTILVLGLMVGMMLLFFFFASFVGEVKT